MTVSGTSPIIVYDCTGGTAYTYPFKIFEDSDLSIVYNDGAGNDTTLTLDIDYTVAGEGDASGGTVTTISTYSAGTLTITRELPYTQEYDLENYGPLPSEQVEEMMDRLVMLCQQIYSEALGGASFGTAAQIKTLYESNSDTNEFSDAEQTKLSGIETAADVTDAANVETAGALMALSDPDADRLMFWDDSEDAVAWLTAGSGLSISDTTVSAVGGGDSGITWEIVTGDTTMVAGYGYLVVSSSAVTLTMPASLSLNETIRIKDLSANSATYNITVARNGHNLNGAAADETIDSNGYAVEYTYSNVTYGMVTVGETNTVDW